MILRPSGHSTIDLGPLEQIGGVQLQCLSELVQSAELKARPLARLDALVILVIQSCLLCERLLCKPTLNAQALEIRLEAFQGSHPLSLSGLRRS